MDPLAFAARPIAFPAWILRYESCRNAPASSHATAAHTRCRPQHRYVALQDYARPGYTRLDRRSLCAATETAQWVARVGASGGQPLLPLATAHRSSAAPRWFHLQ